MPDGMMPAPMMMVFMIVFMVLVFAALVAGVVWLVRTLGEGRRSATRNAIDALEVRYARGEIDRDEYFQRRNDLERPA